MLQEYQEQLDKVVSTIEAFKIAAEGGKEGRGSKIRALESRKLSMQITNELKDFRSISISNDKVK